MGGYPLQHEGEDPSARWEALFAELAKRPGLLRAVSSVEIKLPTASEALWKGYRRSLGFVSPSADLGWREIAKAPPMVWPGLETIFGLLRTFERISSIHVVVTVEERDPVDLDKLWKFTDICGAGLSVEWVLGRISSRSSTRWVGIWRTKWEEFLREKEKLDLDAAILLSKQCSASN